MTGHLSFGALVGLPACVADVTSGSCQPVHGFEPGTPAPLGAAFKLYVLDAQGVPVPSVAVSGSLIRASRRRSAAGIARSHSGMAWP